MHQIAMDKARLFEDFRLQESSPERIHEIHTVGTAYDSVLCADFTYVSTPITSGSSLYTALDAAGVTDIAELKKDKAFFYENVIQPNIQQAESVAHAMLQFGGAVIAPAAFEAKALGWSQDDYMGLWLDTIERKATRLALVDGWQYSNGGCEEYLQALLMQAGRRDRNTISIVDAHGRQLDHATGLILLAGAVTNLLNRNFKPAELARVLHRCVTLHYMLGNESDYGVITDKCGKGRFKVSEHYNAAVFDRETMQATSLGIRDVLKECSTLLSKEELAITSSLALAPGLVRQDGLQELTEQPATIMAQPPLKGD